MGREGSAAFWRKQCLRNLLTFPGFVGWRLSERWTGCRPRAGSAGSTIASKRRRRGLGNNVALTVDGQAVEGDLVRVLTGGSVGKGRDRVKGGAALNYFAGRACVFSAGTQTSLSSNRSYQLNFRMTEVTAIAARQYQMAGMFVRSTM
jgi:hypothetical protein